MSIGMLSASQNDVMVRGVSTADPRLCLARKYDNWWQATRTPDAVRNCEEMSADDERELPTALEEGAGEATTDWRRIIFPDFCRF